MKIEDLAKIALEEQAVASQIKAAKAGDVIDLPHIKGVRLEGASGYLVIAYVVQKARARVTVTPSASSGRGSAGS